MTETSLLTESSLQTDSLLLIGSSAGMNGVADRARSHSRRVVQFATIPEALPAVPDARLIILFQHWPDEYPPTEISQLLNAAPLSRLMVCQSAWCASFGRTRQTWPPAVCVDESRWMLRFNKELSVLSGESAPLPWTAGLDEVFAFDYGEWVSHDSTVHDSMITASR
ncbi:MAG TPA: hypothetical protein VNQ76_20710 [Planctomicrobium sp.]|nr:hypothetical protein [Planctomicrobium sp.]